MTGTLMTIAKDVKIQVEFNPRTVAAYRLIGYENRLLAAEDFSDDTKDAGEIGAGHTVTALYELIPAGGAAEILPVSAVEPLRYQRQAVNASDSTNDELLMLKLRYKEPEGVESREIRFSLADTDAAFPEASADFRFSAAVAAFGLILRRSEWAGNITPGDVANWANSAVGDDPHGHRREFLGFVGKVAEMPR